MKETDLYPPVKAWLEGMGYTVYPEVPFYEACIDVVALCDDVVVAVELKTSLTESVIRQAQSHTAFVDASYAAVGTNPRTPLRIGDAGLLAVRGGVVRVLREPMLRRKPMHYYRSLMVATCRRIGTEGVGGLANQEGGGPAQNCKRMVEKYRKQHPKATWREVFDNVPNHYSSAKSMSQSLTTGLARYAHLKDVRRRHRKGDECLSE